MSMIQELISAVTDSERQIDDQIMKLNSYLQQIEITSKKVDEALSGVKYGEDMINQLLQTKQQINNTIGYLQTAKDRLIQVRMV